VYNGKDIVIIIYDWILKANYNHSFMIRKSPGIAPMFLIRFWMQYSEDF